MIKLISKTTLLTLVVCCYTFIAKAQIGYNYSQFDVGTSAGFNQVFGDAKPQKTTTSINFNVTFNQTPYTNIVFETQLGKLTGGDSLKSVTGRYFNNDFYAFVLRGQLQFGEFMDYSRSRFSNVIKNFYVSTGIGLIKNHITQISRYSVIDPESFAGGDSDDKEYFIPVRIGYEFKLYNQYQQPSVKIDIGYEANFSFGDNIDGLTAGMHNDIYTQFSLGVKFAIGGGMTSYRKQITY
jgi:hypothetical protein